MSNYFLTFWDDYGMIVILVLVAVVLIALIIALMVIYFIELKYSDKNKLKTNDEIRPLKSNQTGTPQRPRIVQSSARSSITTDSGIEDTKGVKPLSNTSSKSLESFISEEGKTAFENAIICYHSDEFESEYEFMKKINRNPIKLVNALFENCQKHKKNWAYNYFYDYIYALEKSKYTILNQLLDITSYRSKKGYRDWDNSYRDEEGNLVFYDRPNYNTVFGTAVALLAQMAGNKDCKHKLTFPDILDENKNPLLYFLVHFRFLEKKYDDIIHNDKHFFIVVHLMNYVYKAFVDGGFDVSKEKWMAMQVKYYDGRLMDCYSEKSFYEEMLTYTKHKEYLDQHILDEIAGE